MRDLTHSFSRLTWALSLFGLKQLADTLSSEDGPFGQHSRPVHAMNSMTDAANSHLGDGFQAAFESGERLIQTFVNAFFGWARSEDDFWEGVVEDPFEGWDPQHADASGMAAGEASTAWVGAWGPMPDAGRASTGSASQESNPGVWGPMPPIPGDQGS